MDSFFAALKKRNQELKSILKDCRKQLENLPEGRLRIAVKPSGPQYYLSGGEKEVYLQTKDRTLVEIWRRGVTLRKLFVRLKRNLNR